MFACGGGYHDEKRHKGNIQILKERNNSLYQNRATAERIVA